ncbi:MAG: hypothetical protein M0Z95_28765 [Actinomycetota bacterium]|nr:hypothetical protein [Actinomycetota bacterium]
MPYLLQPVTVKTTLGKYIEELTAAHYALITQMYAATQAIPEPTAATGNYWAVNLKRNPVSVVGVHDLVGVTTQPLGELLNQLATVERLIDALGWAKTQNMTHVEECHPTTSRGAKETCSHDLVVTNKVDKMVFEVSDVAGDGNANRKMVKDLATLSNCNCNCTGPGDRPARKLLAVSPSSGEWLKATRPGATMHVEGAAPTTWIVEP